MDAKMRTIINIDNCSQWHGQKYLFHIFYFGSWHNETHVYALLERIEDDEYGKKGTMTSFRAHEIQFID